MKVHCQHEWQVSATEAIEIQKKLAGKISRRNEVCSPQLIAGVDISPPDDSGITTGAVVVFSYPELAQVEVQIAQQKPNFLYIPGLLSFREAPVILSACEKLKCDPDIIMVDGQGIAHPRRLGLASHLGIFLNIPTIGCAKSRLCGKHESVNSSRGSFTNLMHKDEIIGAALCTKDRTNPMYISIGHMIDLENAIEWVLKCCQKHKMPEPTRFAHIVAGGAPEKVSNN